jgi:hypothetical protein
VPVYKPSRAVSGLRRQAPEPALMPIIEMDSDDADELEQLLIDILYQGTVDIPEDFDVDRLFNALTALENRA